jgi:hypothetical protein
MLYHTFCDVPFGSKADIRAAKSHVRFKGKDLCL